MQRAKNLLLTLLLLLALLAWSHLALAEETKVKLQVPLSGVNEFSAKEGVPTYIALWFNLVVGSAAVLATVYIVWGGFKWLTAAGNVAKISDAKTTISSALAGLLLAIFSYSILYLVNPNLLKLTITQDISSGAETTENDTSADSTTTSPPTSGQSLSTGVKFSNLVSQQQSALKSNQTLVDLANCLAAANSDSLTITSVTDNNLYNGKCNTSDPNEKYNDPNNCQHGKGSYHYKNCAIDVAPGTATWNAAQGNCAQYIAGKLDEGNHYHFTATGCK